MSKMTKAEQLAYVHALRRSRPIEQRKQIKRPDGYLEIILPASHWCEPMASKSKHSIMVHRLVMAEYLHRLLKSSEIIHHINGIRDDNRIDNLIVTTNQSHELTYRDGYQQGFKDAANIRDKALEKQIKLLQWQLKDALQMRFAR